MINLLYDSLFQAAVISPMAGVILGSLLGAKGGGAVCTYREIHQIVLERQTVVVNQPARQADDDGAALLFVGGAAIVVGMWSFSRYFDEISLSLLGFTAFMASLTIGLHLAALFRGRSFDSWFVDALVSAMVSGYCGGVVWWTRSVMDPYLVAMAKSLGPWEFAKSLSQANWHFLPIQMAGLFLLVLLMLFITMRAIHHLSLYSADPESGAVFWWWLAARTKHATGFWGLATMALLGGAAWLCAIDSMSPDGLLSKLIPFH